MRRVKPKLDFSSMKPIRRRKNRLGNAHRLHAGKARPYREFSVRYEPNARTTPTHRDYSVAR